MPRSLTNNKLNLKYPIPLCTSSKPSKFHPRHQGIRLSSNYSWSEKTRICLTLMTINLH